MACCNKTGCNCKITAGDGVTISGSGTAADPYVLAADTTIVSGDNSQFALTVEPDDGQWTLTVTYGPDATLDDVPDVDAGGADDGDVLSWDAATSTWVPNPPVVAAPGAVLTDDSLSGDGSVGNELAVVVDTDRGLASGVDGVAVKDTLINQTVRKFPNSAARDSADPSAETVNTLTMLGTLPGRVVYWDGTQWGPIDNNIDLVLPGAAQLELSGPYSAGLRVTHLMQFITDDIDAEGGFTVLGDADLAGYSGVLFCQFVPSKDAPAFHCQVQVTVDDRIRGFCWSLVDGEPLTNGTTIHGWVDAWLY